MARGDIYSVNDRPKPASSWWTEPTTTANWCDRQRVEQRRMNASGKDLMPYGYDERRPKQTQPKAQSDEPREVSVRAG